MPEPTRLVSPERRAELESDSKDWPTGDLTPDETDQLELYLRGALDSFPCDAPETTTVLCDPEGVRLAISHTDGSLEGLQLPTHHDFVAYRKSPSDVEPAQFAYATAEPILRAEFESLRTATEGSRLLIITTAVGEGRFHTMRCLKKLPLDELDAEIVLLPFDCCDAEEIAKNFGAQLLTKTDLDLQGGASEFSAVLAELERENPPRHQQGVTVFFTGLSGSGKSTISQIVEARLRESGERKITSLDGDLVRKTLSSGLGFSREDRNRNILRIGWVAGEVNKHGGIAICAPIAPYDEIRKEVRSMSAGYGGFILIHVATPLEVCEARDRKGLYAKARAGIIKEFTGISDPYEEPEDAELVIDTTQLSASEAADRVLGYLTDEGFLAPSVELA